MQLGGECFYTDPDKRRERSIGQPAGDLLGSGRSVTVLYGVGPRAVAILKIDAKILHRLTTEFFGNALIYVLSNMVRDLESTAEFVGIRSVSAKSAHGQLAQPHRCVGLKEVSSTVDRVYGLAASILAGIARRKA